MLAEKVDKLRRKAGSLARHTGLPEESLDGVVLDGSAVQQNGVVLTHSKLVGLRELLQKLQGTWTRSCGQALNETLQRAALDMAMLSWKRGGTSGGRHFLVICFSLLLLHLLLLLLLFPSFYLLAVLTPCFPILHLCFRCLFL